MAEKDDKSKKEVKKEVAKKEPEVNPKKKTVKKEEEAKAPEKKVKEIKKESKIEVKEVSKKEEKKVQNDTNTTIETNKGAVDTAPKSVKKKRKKNGLVIFLTIVTFLLIAAIGFFAILYYTDSDLLKGDRVSTSSTDSSNGKSKAKEKITAIDLDTFKEVFESVGWNVSDLTNHINTSELTEKERIMAVEPGNMSSAAFYSFENEKDAKQLYDDTVERLEDIFTTAFTEIDKEETSGKNWEKYILQNKDAEEGYGVILRVDDTVFALTTDKTKDSMSKIMKKLGYQ